MTDRGKVHEILCLRIGDYITLKNQKPNDGYLSSEGLLSEECFISKDSDQFENCLWQIHIQGQYSALQEYEDALHSHNTALAHESLSYQEKYSDELELPIMKATKKLKSKEVLAQLKKAAINERRLNEKLMQMKIGKAICFGDVIQLRHVKSGKFLTVSDHILAKQERENLRVCLNSKGNTLSYLVFSPRFKYDRDGSTIMESTEVFVKVHDRPGEYIHGAKKSKPLNGMIEVNCSLESTSFSVSIYQQYKESSTKAVLAGQLVSLQEPESSGCLTLDRRTPGLSERAKVIVAHQFTSGISGGVGTNILWLLEKENSTEGGRINLKTNRVTFRDLNSGLYMKQESDRLVAVKDKVDATAFELHNSLASDSLSLQKNASIQISNNNRWFSQLTVATSEKAKYGVECTMSSTDRSKAISFILSTTTQQKYGTDLFVGFQATICLRKFEQLGCRLDRPDAARNPDLISMFHHQVKTVFSTLEHLQLFLSTANIFNSHGFLLDDEYDDMTYHPAALEVLAKRKMMVREQGLIEVLLDLLELTHKNVFDPTLSKANMLPSPTETQAPSKRRISFQKPRTSFEKSKNFGRDKALIDHSIDVKRGNAGYPDVDNNKGSLGLVNDRNPYLLRAREPRKTIFGKLADFTQKTGNSNSNLSNDPQSPTGNPIPSNAIASPTASKSNLNADNSNDVPPMINSRSSWRNSFVGSMNAPPPVTSGTAFDFKNIDEDEDDDGDEPDAKPLPVHHSTASTVQSAIKTLGRRASSLFTGGLNLNALGKSQYPESNQIQPEVVRTDEFRIDEKKSVSSEICESCLKVLLEVVRDCHPNQIVVADRFLTILSLVKSQPIAVKCIEELLRDNLQILQTKVRQREIDMFAHLLYESEMSVTYLRLLQSACSCPSGVDATQRMVALALFGHLNPSSSNQNRSMKLEMGESKEMMINNDISRSMSQYLILNIEKSETRLEATWPHASIYLPSEGGRAIVEVKGYHLYEKGIYSLFVNWTRREEGDYTMMKVFGTEHGIPLELVMQSLNKSRKQLQPGDLSKLKQRPSLSALKPAARNHQSIRKTIGIRSTIHTSHIPNLSPQQQSKVKKSQIAEYLVQQLYVVADVCLDRNYVAMNMLEKAFSYDILLSVLKLPNIPNKLKAPVARIIRCLHIDRDPQEASRYPRLIRLASVDESDLTVRVSGQGNEGRSSFLVFHSGPPTTFGILQEILSEYIRNDLNTCKCDAFSTEMTQLLHSLLQFGFYTTQEQIQDVIEPLIHALDRHMSTNRDSSNQDGIEEAASSSGKLVPRNQATRGLQGEANKLFNSFMKLFSVGDKNTEDVNTSQKIIPLGSLKYDSSQTSFAGTRARSNSYSSSQSKTTDPTIDKHLSKRRTFAFKYLMFIESIYGLLLTFLVVVATIIVVFIQLFSSRDNSQLDIFNYCVTAFFASEIILRFVSYTRIYDNYINFFKDVFNDLDLVLVIIDIILIGFYNGSRSIASSGRILRAFRAVRLFRLVRAARLLRSIAQAKSKKPWSMPRRYSSIVSHEAKTIVNIIRILSMIYHRIQNKHIGVVIKAFRLWSESQSYKKKSYVGNRRISGYEIYQDLLMTEKDITNIIPSNFDDVLKDIIMYHDSTLTEDALHLLMIHKSNQRLLLNICSQVQVIFTKQFEDSFKNISSILRKLKQLTEKYEIWSSLESEADQEMSANVLTLVGQIQSSLLISNEDRSLAMKHPYLIDDETQSILRNLDGMGCFMFVLETLYNGGRDVPSKPVVAIMAAVINLICWFVKGSPENQAEAFKYYNWFVERIDDNINSGKVLREILLGNKELIKQCPKPYIADFAKKIMTKGHRPEYLEMFLGMTDGQEDGNGIPSVDSEIAKYLTSREWKDDILLWFCPPTSIDYLKRREAMEKYAVLVSSTRNKRNNIVKDGVDIYDDLPSELAYHVKLLTIVAGCNLGPKLQAVYSTDDILHALLDPLTVFPVKKGLAALLVGSIQSGLDRVRYSEYLWKYLDATLEFIEHNVGDLSSFLSSDKITIEERIERSDGLDIALAVIISVFQDFDVVNFTEYNSSDDDFKYSRRSEQEIKSSIRKLFVAVKNLLEFHGLALGGSLKESAGLALSCLLQHCDTVPLDFHALGINKESSDAIRQRRTIHNRRSVLKATDEEEKTERLRYRYFIDHLRHELMRTDLSLASIQMFEAISSKYDTTIDADVRIEPFIKKITSHLRSNLRSKSSIRSLKASSVETTTWVLQTLRQLMECHLSFTFGNNALFPQASSSYAGFYGSMDSNPGGNNIPDAENPKVSYYRTIFNDNGVVFLCMDLICIGVDQSLCIEAIKLLVVLLLKSGGCPQIQQSIYDYLKENDTSQFFEYLKDTIDNIYLWTMNEIDTTDENSSNNYSHDDEEDPEEDQEDNKSEEIVDKDEERDNKIFQQYNPFGDTKSSKELPGLIVFFLLQLMCEGEFSGIKNYVREQTKNSKIVNILDSLSNLIDFLSRHNTVECCAISTTILRTIQKLLSGPCRGNQDQLILHTELLVSLNRFMRFTRPIHRETTAMTLQSLFQSVRSISNKQDPSFLQSMNRMSIANAAVSIRGLGTSARGLLRGTSRRFQLQNEVYEDFKSSNNEHLDLLKETVINVLRAAIEGQPKTSVVFERVSTTIEFNVLNLLLLPPELKATSKSMTTASIDFETRNLGSIFNLSPLQSKYLVFVETLGHLRSNLPLLAQHKIEKEISSVEVIWKNEVHKVYFHILDLSRELSDVSKEQVTADIDSMSHELKLKEFTMRCRSLFKEAEHQHFLQSIGLSNVWGIKTRITWIMFVNAVIMNFLTLGYLGTKDGGYAIHSKYRYLAASSTSDNPQSGEEPFYIAPIVDQAIFSLNIIQIALAATTVLLIIIGQMPVTFAINTDKGKSITESLFSTAFEPLSVWYMLYFIVAMFGVVYNRLWLSVLLLDWMVLDSTTRDVLLAVRYPAKQLFATLIIICIFVNIFAAVYFYFFRQDIIFFNVYDMWEAFKLTLSYGIRGEYGVAHEMNNTLHNRMIVDLAFYFIMLAILRHIFFAIIVDTFGKLRELKFERELEENNTCFICGVERHDYDKISHQGSNFTFSDHRSITHNPLNYLSFMMHLWKQPREEDSGVEMHVRKCLSVGNVGWFPIGIVTDTRAEDTAFNRKVDGMNNSSSNMLLGSWDGDDMTSLMQGPIRMGSSSNSERMGRENSINIPTGSGILYHQVGKNDSVSGSGSDSNILDKLNMIQKHLSALSENGSLQGNGRQSVVNSRQNSVLYNSNIIDRDRQSGRFRLSGLFNSIAEESNDEEYGEESPGSNDMQQISPKSTITSMGQTNGMPMINGNMNMDMYGNDRMAMTQLDEIMKAITTLNKSVQDISNRMNTLESNSRQNEGNVPGPRPDQKSGLDATAPSEMSKVTPILPVRPKLMSQTSLSSMKSVSEGSEEDDDGSGELVPRDSNLRAKLENVRSSPNLLDLRRYGPASKQTSQTLDPLAIDTNAARAVPVDENVGISPTHSSNVLSSSRISMTRQQQLRDSVVGPSRALLSTGNPSFRGALNSPSDAESRVSDLMSDSGSVDTSAGPDMNNYDGRNV